MTFWRLLFALRRQRRTIALLYNIVPNKSSRGRLVPFRVRVSIAAAAAAEWSPEKRGSVKDDFRPRNKTKGL